MIPDLMIVIPLRSFQHRIIGTDTVEKGVRVTLICVS